MNNDRFILGCNINKCLRETDYLEVPTKAIVDFNVDIIKEMPIVTITINSEYAPKNYMRFKKRSSNEEK